MADHYFLGGQDLEMQTIARLLADSDALYSDHALGWGARASDYGQEIARALGAGQTPVLVELALDLPRTTLACCAVIDHHGAQAGAAVPTALEQTFARLGATGDQWTRDFALVAANDRGHIAELLAMGATPAEIADIRRRDRRAQGVTTAQEAAAADLIRRVTVPPADSLAREIISLDFRPHHRASPLLDRLADKVGFGRAHNVLVQLADRELGFYGNGGAVLALAQHFDGGWHGGALPTAGFWGHKTAARDTALDVAQQALLALDAAK